MTRVAGLVCSFLVASCGDSSAGSPAEEPGGESVPPRIVFQWPPAEMDLPVEDASLRSPCVADTPILSSDSIGFLRVGLTLNEVLTRCPDAAPSWDWGAEAIASPVVTLRLGSVPFVVTLADTLLGSRVIYVATSDTSAATRDGVRPGMLLSEARERYGDPRFAVGECGLYAVFEREPRLSWRLSTPDSLDCPEIELIPERGVSAVPDGVRILSVHQFGSAG